MRVPVPKRIKCCIPVLLIGIVNSALAQDFGRLFTTPEQRRALEALKLNQETPNEAPELEAQIVAAPTPVNAPSELRFSGFIQRSDGNYAIWINGQSALSYQDSPVTEAQFLAEDQAMLRVGKQQALMKPGQIWSLESNTVREGYYIERQVEVMTEPGSDPAVDRAPEPPVTGTE